MSWPTRLRRAGGKLRRACDLADASAIDSLGGLLGQMDVLVLNTGGPPPGPADEISDAVWVKQFEAMFLSAVRLTRLALPGMRKRGFGRIIVVVSSGVVQPIPNLGISNAIRSALVLGQDTGGRDCRPRHHGESRCTWAHRD